MSAIAQLGISSEMSAKILVHRLRTSEDVNSLGRIIACERLTVSIHIWYFVLEDEAVCTYRNADDTVGNMWGGVFFDFGTFLKKIHNRVRKKNVYAKR